MSDAPGAASPRRSYRTTLVRVGKSALSIAAVVALGVLLYRERDLFSRALRMDASDFLLIAGFTLASWLASALAQSAVLRALDRPLPYLEVLALHAGGGLLNHLPMRAGTLYRAYYLKERTSLVYSHFASFTAMNLLLPIAAAGLIGAGTLAFAYDLAEYEVGVLFTVLLGMSVASGVVLVVPLPRSSSSARLGRVWNEVLAGRSAIARFPTVFLVVAMSHSASVVFGALRFLGAYSSMEIELGFAALLVLGAVGLGIRLISLTPGGIGIQELVVAATATLLGIPLATGIVAASVVRAVALLCYFVVGGTSLGWLRRFRPLSRARKE